MNARRGTIIDSEVREDEFTAIAEVALNDMFGYSSQLRGATQGKGEFSMEYKVQSSIFECRAMRTDDYWCRTTCPCCRMCRLSCRKSIANLCRTTTKSRLDGRTEAQALCVFFSGRSYAFFSLSPYVRLALVTTISCMKLDIYITYTYYHKPLTTRGL